MTENLIEPNKVVCVNSFYVILLKFTFVLSGEKETWSKLTAFLVCIQSYLVTEGILHIPQPPIIIHTFPYPNISFQESLFSSFYPSHPCSSLPVQTAELLLSSRYMFIAQTPAFALVFYYL